ncbi:MAG TPA: hypothetical protein VGK19_14010 [Capsulimonadaceae bacterium]|jgi:hypothetical protein
MQKTLTAIVVLILLLIVVGLNSTLMKNTEKDHDDDNPAPTAQKTEAKPAPKPAGAPPAPVYEANTAATGPIAEAVIGTGSAPSSLALGYTWDPATQQNQDALKKIITDVENWGAKPGHHVQIVCVDIPADQRQYPENATVVKGISVNGKPLAAFSGNPGSDIKPAEITKLLASLK